LKLSTQIATIVATVSKLLPKLMDPVEHEPFKIIIESDRQGRVKIDWYKRGDDAHPSANLGTGKVIPENFKYHLQNRG